MSRDWRFYAEDILSCCAKVKRYIGDHTRESFIADERTFDAVVRNSEIIGEAAKHLPEEIREQHPEIPWRSVAGFRDVVAHAYFGLDDQAVWSVATTRLEALAVAARRILSS